MPKEIRVPRLGWSMEEGVFGEWLKAPGEFVRAGEMVFVLEGDKAAHEIESFDSGFLCVPSDAPKPSATVKVGQVIGFLLSEGEPAPVSVGRGDGPTLGEASKFKESSTSHLRSAESLPRSLSTDRVAGPVARRRARELGVDYYSALTPDPTGRVIRADIERTIEARMGGAARQAFQGRQIATPRARRRARELGIDWKRLKGTGRGGRVREQDIHEESTRLSNAAFAKGIDSNTFVPSAPGEHTPASKMRLALAKRMSAGVHQAAPVTLTSKVDASALVSLRDHWKSEKERKICPSYTDLMIKLAALTLRELPDLNACWHKNGIWSYNEVNIAMAVDTELGLVAPVIQNSDQLSIFEVAEKSRALIEQARVGKLTQSQLDGGTFTITNLGMYEIDSFTPILNLPQAAILGVGRIVSEPVAREGKIEIGSTLTLSLTFDHRVIDGAPAARWLQRLCERVLSPTF